MRFVLKKLSFLLASLFISLSLSAKTSYYSYSKQEIELNDLSYRRYIIPQLHILTDSYYQLLSISGYRVNSLKDLKKSLVQFEKLYRTSKELCAGDDPNVCLSQIESMYFEAKDLLRITMLFQKEVSDFFDEKKGVSKDRDIVYHHIDQLETTCARLVQKLRNFSLEIEKYHKHKSSGLLEIASLVESLNLRFYRIPFLVISEPLREMLYNVWVLFFRNIEKLGPTVKDRKYLMKRLEELNIAWNTFHMKTTKGPYQIDPKIQSSIKIMHNRWNLVLKVILK